MKVGLNLSFAESRRERYALAWAIPAAVVGLAGLLFLLVSTVRQLKEYRSVQMSVTEHQEQENRLRAQELGLQKELDQPRYRQLLHEAQFVNTLIDKKQVSLTDVAQKVSKLLTGQVRLTGLALAPKPDGLMVRFTVTGRNEEAVESFLGNLEDSPDFKDPVLSNQGFQEEGGASGPVTIACTARYMPGAH